MYKIISTPSGAEGALFVGRFTVPCDDKWHMVGLSGGVLHVDCRSADSVEFWAITDRDGKGRAPRYFRVFGTGQALPENSKIAYVGTALTPGGVLVWHLMELHSGTVDNS